MPEPRPGAIARALLAVIGCALVVVPAGCGRVSPATRSTYTLMQMNLCLSGLAGCYRKTAYPAVVEEAVADLRRARPDAATFNEACRNDAAQIARRAGYHLRFSRVVYLGKPLRCITPGGRGIFGDAVLTKAVIVHAESEPFRAQAGVERRRWLCVTTRFGIEVCTAHLNERIPVERAGNDAQCAELAALLAHRAAAGHTVIFGGDVNRRPPCAPGGFWTRTDRSAHQAPGLQQVYGTRELGAPAAQVVPAAHSDHDVLLVRAHLTHAPARTASTATVRASPSR